MTDFEKAMEKSFGEYYTVGLARLQFVHPRMKVGGMRGNTPMFVQVAKAPYDLDGYFLKGARYIACEVKENGKHKTSLPIIAPLKKGTGLHYHQLEALVQVHESGGLACVVWDNAGEVGFLDGSRLKAAKAAMDTALKAKAEGYPETARGSRSILWGNFQSVGINGMGAPLWLDEKLRR